MKSPAKPSSKRRVTLILSIVTIVIVLGTVALLNVRPRSLADQITWLTPAEFAQIKRVGPLTRLKYQLMRWTAPLWRSHSRNQPQLTIGASVVTLPVEMLWPTNSLSSFVTATNGTRSRILSPGEQRNLQSELSALPESAVAIRSQVIVGGGLAAQVASANTTGSGSNIVSYGTTVYLISDVAGDKVVLTFELNHSELATDLAVGELRTKTNQAYACRAVFPNNGGVLIENPNPEPGASNRHWLFLSAKAVDATGRLIGR